ncbi:MAG: hypothetical protein JWM68_4710, partial [Verrucomicrobiales bacterium]|nr:hypothetical protein [Verrucomicrobiales bacterium]
MKSLLLGACILTIAILFAASFTNANPPVATQPIISNISVDGETVLVSVELPAGFTRAVLQTRASLKDAWEDGPTADSPAAGGKVQFHFPRRGEMLFMRILASAAAGQTGSRELTYLTVPTGPVTEPGDKPIVKRKHPGQLVATFHFKAVIDGLDTIRIERTGILWDHLRYQSPHEVSINGRSWDPAEVNFIDLGSA